MKRTMERMLVILLITMLIASSALVLQAHAADVGTEAFLSATPNPVGVGQLLNVNMLITPPPPTGFVLHGLTVNVTKPDGFGEAFGPFTTDAAGAASFTYIPTSLGTYHFYLNYPGEDIGIDSVYYMPSVSDPLDVTVQEEPVYALVITVNPPIGGSVSKVPDQDFYNLGDIVQLTANANEGYTFVGWSGDLTGTANPANLTIDSTPQVTAYFAQQYISPGPDQTIYPDPNVVMHFEQVTTGGTVTVTPSDVPPVPPLPGITPYYYISAGGGLTFTGKVTIGIHYDDTGLTQQQEELLGLWRFDPAVPVKGDVDGNGKVDLKDLLIIVLALGTKPGQKRWNPACDLNGDLKIDLKDLCIAIMNFGKSSTGTWTNITAHVDTVNNIVYGDTDHFSPYRVH